MGTLREKQLNSKTGGLAFSIDVVLYVLLSFLFGLIFKLCNLSTDSDVYLYIAYLVSPVSIAVTVAVVSRFRGLSAGDLFKPKCRPKYYLIGVLLFFGLLIGLSWVNDVTMQVLNRLGYQESLDESMLPDLSSGGKIALAVLFMAVLPAVAEETLFRGLILHSSSQNMSDVSVVFIVGFCFALFHGTPEQTVYQFICGCMFALLALRAGSTLPSIFAHFLNNALIVVVSALSDPAAEEAAEATPAEFFAVIVLFALGVIAFVAALVLLLTDKNAKPKETQKGGVKNFFLYASVGIAVMALVWVVSLINGFNPSV